MLFVFLSQSFLGARKIKKKTRSEKNKKERKKNGNVPIFKGTFFDFLRGIGLVSVEVLDYLYGVG